MKLICASFLALALVCGAGCAEAKDLPAGGMTATELVGWLQTAGFQAQAGATKDGTPYVKSAADGMTFGIFLYGCDKGRCTSLQFVTSFPGAGKITSANAWNRDYRWIRAYTDGDKDLIFDFDVDLFPGVSYEGLGDQFEIWCRSIPDMRRMATH